MEEQGFGEFFLAKVNNSRKGSRCFKKKDPKTLSTEERIEFCNKLKQYDIAIDDFIQKCIMPNPRIKSLELPDNGEVIDTDSEDETNKSIEKTPPSDILTQRPTTSSAEPSKRKLQNMDLLDIEKSDDLEGEPTIKNQKISPSPKDPNYKRESDSE